MSGLTRDSRQKKGTMFRIETQFLCADYPPSLQRNAQFFFLFLGFYRLIQRLTTWFLRASSSCFQLYPSCTAVTQLELEMLETTFFFSQKRSISKIKERRICCILLLRLPAFVLNGFYNNWKTVFLFFVFIWWPLCGKNVLFEKLVIFPGTFSLKLYGRLWT